MERTRILLRTRNPLGVVPSGFLARFHEMLLPSTYLVVNCLEAQAALQATRQSLPLYPMDAMRYNEDGGTHVTPQVRADAARAG